MNQDTFTSIIARGYHQKKAIPNSIMMAKLALVEELISNPPFELSETDQAVLRTAENAFIPHSWENMKDIIG